jgi:tetratricopeptide (TPR) repeat protein
MTLEDMGLLEDSLGWLNKSIALSNPTTSTLRKVFYVKARALRRLERDSQAEEALRTGIGVYPNDPELNFALAEILLSTGRPEEAISCLNAMQTDTSDHFGSVDVGILGPKRRMALARAILNLDRYREAADELRKLLADGFPDAGALLYEAALNRRDLMVAEEALNALLRLNLPDERWCIARARLSEAMGQPPESSLYPLIQALPAEPAPYLVLSRILLERGDHARAMPLLQALSNLGVAEGAINMGILYAQRGQLQPALDAYSRALALDPNNEMAKSQIEAFERAIAANPPE